MAFVQGNGDAEIRQVGLSRSIQQDVRRLQVLMDKALLMGVLKMFGDLGDQADGLLQRQRTTFEESGQVCAVDELRDDEPPPFGWPTSKTGTMPGWRRLATLRASARKASMSRGVARSGRVTLIATIRCRSGSNAFQTSPKPPSPIRFSSR